MSGDPEFIQYAPLSHCNTCKSILPTNENLCYYYQVGFGGQIALCKRCHETHQAHKVINT